MGSWEVSHLSYHGIANASYTKSPYESKGQHPDLSGSILGSNPTPVNNSNRYFFEVQMS